MRCFTSILWIRTHILRLPLLSGREARLVHDLCFKYFFGRFIEGPGTLSSAVAYWFFMTSHAKRRLLWNRTIIILLPTYRRQLRRPLLIVLVSTWRRSRLPGQNNLWFMYLFGCIWRMFWRISVRLNLGIIYSFFTTCCGIKIGLVLYPKSCLCFKLIWLTCPIYQLWLTACDSSLLILWYAQVIHHIGNSNSYRSLFACGAWFLLDSRSFHDNLGSTAHSWVLLLLLF